MIGFIKKIFSGVLSFLFGLVGGRKSEGKLAPSNSKPKKSKGFFMELNEEDENPLANGTQAVKAELNKAADKTKEAVGDAVGKTKELVAAATKSASSDATSKPASSESTKASSKPASNAKAKVEPRQATKSTTNNQAVKTEATANNSTAKTEATANNAAAKVELVQTDVGVKAEPAKQTKSSAAKANTQTPTETTFAPKYLIPTNTNGRRRPGPNMNTFLDMARQVKTPG